MTRLAVIFSGVLLVVAAMLPTHVNAQTTFTTYSTSAAEIDTVINTPVIQQENTYSTELIVQMQGGPVLSDQTLTVPFADPSFQSMIGAAEATLTGDGASSFIGPNLLSSANTPSSTTQIVQTGTSTEQVIFNTALWIGPATVDVGEFGVCQSYTINPLTSSQSSGLQPTPDYLAVSGCTGGTSTTINVGSGAIDYNTLILSLVDIDTTTTTTNTDLLTQVYGLVGVPAATTALPEPSSWMLLGVGLLGIGCVVRLRIVTVRMCPHSV